MTMTLYIDLYYFVLDLLKNIFFGNNLFIISLPPMYIQRNTTEINITSLTAAAKGGGKVATYLR